MEGVERAIASGGLASSGYGTDAESAGSGFGEQVSTKSMAGIQESMSKRAGDGSVTSGGASAEMGSVDDQQSMAGHGSVRWSSKGSMVTAGMAMQLGSTGLEGDSLKRVVSGDDCSGNASGARVASPLTSRGAASSFSVPFGQSQQPRTPPGLAAASMAGSLPGTGIFNGPAGPHAAMRSGPADKQGCASREHQQPRPIFTAMAFNPSPSSSSVPLQSFGLYSAADGLASGAANESGHAPQLSVFANPAPSPPVRSSAEPTCPYVRSASSAEISDARSAAPTVMMTSSPVSPPAYKSLASTAQPLFETRQLNRPAAQPSTHRPVYLQPPKSLVNFLSILPILR
ncbi:hypothetical protein BC831DRAFT_260108 [Entophlyctis helioformis]|nr:hypothetical protein BC831DRAFT_260108 [Entophlyctis helioformis]